MAKKKKGVKMKRAYREVLAVFLCVLLLAGMFSACGMTGPVYVTAGSPVPTAAESTGESPGLESTPAAQTAQAAPTEDANQKAALEEKQKAAVQAAEVLRRQYDYDAALAALASPALAGAIVDKEIAAIRSEVNSLVNYTGDIPHIFFHSLIVYPEMIFSDKKTPMGGYNAGFSEKAELEKILPQLYERGYVLYDLNECWDMIDGKMTRKDILLPPGKSPLIFSVDDVAYAYGKGFAQALTVKDGALVYQIKDADGKLVEMPDGDVMGVVDLFVAEHPDFAYRGHKGTIALTGYQGAFGYSYDTDQGAVEIRKVSTALKADGWNFASHSYTHNRANFYGPGSNPSNIKYDINKWVATVPPCIGQTRLFIAPFGYRVKQPALQYILDDGFNIYCTVSNSVQNELYDDYALMTRIEISGYSMTYYKDTLNKLFFNVDEVFDAKGRPPVV